MEKNNKLLEFIKAKKFILLAAVLVLVAIIILIIILCNKGDKTSSSEEFDITASTSFFLKNKEGKYALFDENGKNLTDFIFTSASGFVNGTALVKQDKNVGVINQSGKMVIDFGKYQYIRESAGLYKVEDNEYNYALLNNKGDLVFDLKNKDVDTFIGEDTFSVIEEKDKKTYSVINYEGKVMGSFPVVNDKDAKLRVNAEKEYVTVFYNNKNYVYNSKTAKEIASYESDKHFCVNIVKDDIITFNSCVGSFESQDKTSYKVYTAGKMIDVSEDCTSLYFNDKALVCKRDNNEYLLDNNFKPETMVQGKSYIKNGTYVEQAEGSFNGVDFYVDGKKIKHVDCRSIKETGYASGGLYVLGTYSSSTCGTTFGEYEFYNENGKLMFGKSFKKVFKFDDSGLARVSDDKTNYYLIDSTGKKVSEDYSQISKVETAYIVTKDGKKGILALDGTKLVDTKYSSAEINSYKKNISKLKTDDDKYIIFDLDAKKEIIVLPKAASFNKNYIETTTDNGKQYFSYEGKLIYKEK